MKKHISLILAVIILAAGLTACGTETKTASQPTRSPNIVTTIFPVYDWVQNILRNNPAQAEVTMLLDSGVDLHSYQPTVDDILKIATCDLFLYVGGESDEWVDAALEEAVNQDMVVLNLMDLLGERVKEEELVPGMEEEEEEEAEAEEDTPEYDEHIWLSLRNAACLVNAISEAMQSLDPDHAETYKNNTASYTEKLEALDQRFVEAVEQAKISTLLFGDRFPFRYLVDDYGLSYYAAFSGCSAEAEASFETVIFLAQKVDELALPAVLTIEGTDHRIAETIVQNTQSKDQQILTMDSMQSITAKDVENGATYLGIMEENCRVLKEALESTAQGIDVDLTSLSSTMVYAEVYNMMYEPEKYIGQTIKMRGDFTVYTDENTGQTYYSCIIKDATACCAQGIEFILTDDYSYPEDYPEVGGTITVIGTFDTYTEGEYRFCTLRDASLGV